MDGTERVACCSRTQAGETQWRFSSFLPWDCLKYPIC